MNDQILDFDEFWERVQGDKELLLELFDLYVTDYGNKRKALTAAVESNNAEEIRNIAHSLKGASGNISAKSLRESFTKMEDDAKKNELSGVAPLLPVIDKQFGELLIRIESVKKELGQK